MNIGDKVRSKHGFEEGIVKRVLPKNIIEVEIEDGFVVPLVKSELVIVSALEDNYFSTSTTENTPQEQHSKPQGGSLAEKGIYLAIEEVNDTIYFHLINNTDLSCLIAIDYSTKGANTNAFADKVLSKTASLILEKKKVFLQNKPSFSINIIKTYASKNTSLHQETLLLSPKKLFKRQQKAPLIDKEAVLFLLDDQDVPPITIDKSELANQINENKPASNVNRVTSNEDLLVDLHIEALVDYEINEGQQFDFQKLKFEQALDEAIVSGVNSITFIHGVGNGTLRNYIHKTVSSHPHVAYFKDAQKEKFGYGATYLKL